MTSRQAHPLSRERNSLSLLSREGLLWHAILCPMTSTAKQRCCDCCGVDASLGHSLRPTFSLFFVSPRMPEAAASAQAWLLRHSSAQHARRPAKRNAGGHNADKRLFEHVLLGRGLQPDCKIGGCPMAWRILAVVVQRCESLVKPTILTMQFL